MTVQLAAPRTSLSFARTARIARFVRPDSASRSADSARRSAGASSAGASSAGAAFAGTSVAGRAAGAGRSVPASTAPAAPAVPAPSAGPVQMQAVPRIRLTRRGRLLLIGAPIMLGGAALLTFVGFFTAPALAAGGSGELTRTQQVSISSGDSLWSLATEYAPDRDPREVVADIMELNNLADAVVPAGVQLYVPVSR